MNEDVKAKHRVIGIRSALKAFKNDGLLDDDTMYPDNAVDEIRDQMLRLAKKWYRIGARRGALETVEALLNGDLEVKKHKGGDIDVIAHKVKLSWHRGLNVTVGDRKVRIKKRKYAIDTKADLGFE